MTASLGRAMVKALLAYVCEVRLQPYPPAPLTVHISCPWDVWWICRRAATTAAELGLTVPDSAAESCYDCWRQVVTLVNIRGVGDPDPATQQCQCLYDWAVTMRQPGPDPDWPPLRTQLAMVKPGTHPRSVRRELDHDYRVIGVTRRRLSIVDVRRLYPDAYGTAFVAAQDSYLVGASVDVLILLTRTNAPDVRQVKTTIRTTLGHGDLLRNHLHMPDSPGDTLCDLAHLTGPAQLVDLYERYERDGADQRLAHYRAVLAPQRSRPHQRQP